MLVYDVETLRVADEVEGGWDNVAGMGFGSCVVYDDINDYYTFFGPNDQELCEEYLTQMPPDCWAVSFNGLQFDQRVIQGENRTFNRWKEFDLLWLIWAAKFNDFDIPKLLSDNKWELLDGSCNLNALCGATLSRGKVGKDVVAPQLIQQGRWAELYSYNLHDVRLTYKLYRFIIENGHCIDGNGNKIVIEPEHWNTYMEEAKNGVISGLYKE